MGRILTAFLSPTPVFGLAIQHKLPLYWSMNTSATLSIILRHLISALTAIQRDIQEAERTAPSREPPTRPDPSIQQAPAPSKKLLNTTEAAEYLGVSKSWVYRMTMTREIPFFKIGSRTLFKEEQLLTWLASREHTPDDLLPHSRRRN